MEKGPDNLSVPLFKRLGSFLIDQVVERSSSPYNKTLEVCLSSGKLVLNSSKVNLSFGELDNVFRSAFDQIHLHKRDWEQVLLLGVGAGNVVQILSQFEQKFELTGVEIDPEVIRLANKYFGLKNYERVDILVQDALQYIKESTQRFDLIIVDLFIDENIPEEAQQDAFLLRCAQALKPRGMLMFNRLMHTKKLQKASEAFTARMQEVLPGSRYLKTHTNRMLIYEKK